MYERMNDEYSRRRLLLGVERLDYSKGLPQRLRAFRELLKNYPENIRSATLIQIASPSREALDTYTGLRQELESLCGAINGDYGELDWMPVRYIHRNVARKRLAGLYRAADVALVTPLRDGMNLVAKEFIAAQDPADPGVLVLSRFAGAAEQLQGSAAGQPVRHSRHGRKHPAGAADAADRAPAAPPAAAGARAQPGCALVAQGVSRCALGLRAGLMRVGFSARHSRAGGNPEGWQAGVAGFTPARE